MDNEAVEKTYVMYCSKPMLARPSKSCSFALSPSNDYSRSLHQGRSCVNEHGSSQGEWLHERKNQFPDVVCRSYRFGKLSPRFGHSRAAATPLCHLAKPHVAGLDRRVPSVPDTGNHKQTHFNTGIDLSTHTTESSESFREDRDTIRQDIANMASSSTPASPLIYSCIAYHSTILTEHTSSAVGTSNIASVILPKIQHNTAQKLTYTHNQNNIHYIADAPPSNSSADSLSAGGLTYLVVAKADVGRRIPFGFLVEIKKRFLKDYDAERTDFSSLPAYGAAAFNTQLKNLMLEYGTTKAGQNDAFANVQSEIDNVRGIMTENIERVLERGERIDLLVDKTDRLGGSARDFRVRSRGLRRKMWWKNMKLMVLLAVVIVFLVYLLVGFGCGLPGKWLSRVFMDLNRLC